MRHIIVLGLALCSFFCGGALVYQALEQHSSLSLPAVMADKHTPRDAVTSAEALAPKSMDEKGNVELHKIDNEVSFSEGWNEGESTSERRKYDQMRLADPATGQIPTDALVRERAFTRTLPSRGQDAQQQKGRTSLQSFEWTSIGPTGTGGRTRALAIDADNERIMLAGSVTGGLWRTENGGASWSRVATPDGSTNISCIVQDTRPGKRNVWYYGTGELYTAFFGTGLYKSVDGGRSWRSLPATVPALLTRAAQYASPWSTVIRIALDPTKLNQDVVYAAISGSVMRSSDGGDTWQVALGNTSSSNINSAFYTDVAVASNGVVYAALSEMDFSFQLSSFAVQSGIWRSTNGTNWTNISPQIAGQTSSIQVGRMVIATAPSDSNTVYVLRDVRTPNSTSGFKTGLLRYMYLSGSGASSGGTWTDYSTTFPQDFKSQAGYCMALKVKPDDALFVIAGGVFAYSNPYNFRYRETTSRISAYATDADVPTPATQSWADHHDFAFLPSNPNVMFVANDGGIYRTDNCTATPVRYTPLNTNYVTTQFYTLAIDHATKGNETIIGGLQDNGTRIVSRTDASGRFINEGDGVHCAIADGGRYYYASSQNASISRFEIDGSGRRRNILFISPRANNFQSFFFDNPYVLDPNNQSTMYLAGGTSLWRNTDITSLNSTQLQAAWKSIGSVGTDERITSLSVSERPAGVVYVGTSRGRVYRMGNANAPDSSRKFVNVSSGLPQNSFTSCVALDPTNADWALAVYSNYNVQSVFSTTNGGKTWSAVGGNLEETMSGVGGGPSVAWVKVVYVGGKVWYLAGTSSGLFSSDRLNGTGTRWVREGTSTIGTADVRMIDARSNDGFVAVATHGNGFFTSYLPTQTRRFNAEAPTILLGQSYPNPASRVGVTIPFFLPRSSRVTLTLWNALGQAIATPLEANLTAGEQFFLMPTSNIPAGTYIYRIEAEGLQAQGSMVVRP